MERFIDPSKRYRLFFDETGTGHLQDPNQPYLSLTGIAIRQDLHDGATTRQLNALKLAVFKTENVVLHRREIMNAKGEFASLQDQAIRKAFDDGFAKIVGDLSPPAFTVSIDKKAHLEKYKIWQFSPYHYALTCLLERFVLWLHYSDLVGDVMGEGRNPKHDAQLRRAFRFFYANGTEVRKDVIQARLTSKELRLEPKTANIAALQIADLLAHPAHRAYKFDKQNIEHPNDYGTKMANVLREKTYHRSKRGQIEGYGRKWLP